MINKHYCQAYETIELEGITYQRVADDHYGWWTTPEQYQAAIAAMGDLDSEDDEYRRFCDLVGEVPPATAERLDTLFAEMY